MNLIGPRALLPSALFITAQFLTAADHGPVFGLATPTNPQGGWSFDLGVNGRSGTASNLDAELTYGLTQNIKLAVSGPVVFQPDPYPRSSVTTNTPISGDFSGLAWWRFQKKDFVGKRVESTPLAGLELECLRRQKPASTAACTVDPATWSGEF